MLKFIAFSWLVLAGHVGWWIFCYNRINATALPRRLIKAVELLIIALTVAIPLAVAIALWPALERLFTGQTVDDVPPLALAWMIGSIAAALVLGPGWLESRWWLWPPANLLSHRAQRVDVAREVDQPVTSGWLSNSLRRLPLNEITHLSVTTKTLQLERAFTGDWQSLTIGHISDLHFTGELTPAYYHYVVDRLQALRPDLIAVTGDIIDTEACFDWIDSILGRLDAPLGCHFLFGNHERRLASVEPVARRLVGLGWRDVGVEDVVLEGQSAAGPAGGRPRIVLCGNERPWFERHTGDHWQTGPLADAQSADALRIALAHTPDQHPWARELGMDLMLAGHTHGGQVRIPGLGPLIAPSRYGSRFASGVFRLPPVVMHVSRGLSGTQPLRWRCPPEISVLTVVPSGVRADAPRPAIPAAERWRPLDVLTERR